MTDLSGEHPSQLNKSPKGWIFAILNSEITFDQHIMYPESSPDSNMQIETEIKTEFTIRRALPTDAEEIFNLRRDIWIDTYQNSELGITPEGVQKYIEGEDGEKIQPKIDSLKSKIESVRNDSHDFFVALVDNKIVGYASPFIEKDGRRRLGSLYISPDMQGKGLGTKLLNMDLEWHGLENDVYLFVTSYNQKAISFYKNYHFEKTGVELVDENVLIDGKGMPEFEMVHKGKR